MGISVWRVILRLKNCGSFMAIYIFVYWHAWLMIFLKKSIIMLTPHNWVTG